MRKLWSRIIAGMGIAAAFAMPALGHDFWLQPVRFTLEAPGALPLRMLVGHGNARERWQVGNDKVALFNTAGPDGIVARTAELTLGAPGFDAVLRLRQPGAYVVAMQSESTFSELPALRFNDYVADEGITPIVTDRNRRGAQRESGSEFYSRRAKAIVQVGPVGADDVQRATRPVGLFLELVPGRHPAQIAGGVMPVTVLWNGRPLRGAMVKLTDLAADAEPVSRQRTDARGRANVRIPHPGAWQMNVVWSQPLPAGSPAQYRTTFSSLAFETP